MRPGKIICKGCSEKLNGMSITIRPSPGRHDICLVERFRTRRKPSVTHLIFEHYAESGSWIEEELLKQEIGKVFATHRKKVLARGR